MTTREVTPSRHATGKRKRRGISMFRRRRTQLIRACAMCVAVAIAVAGCGGSSSSSSGGSNGGSSGGTSSSELKIAYQANIASFDPDNSFEVAGLGAVRAVYQGLVT